MDVEQLRAILPTCDKHCSRLHCDQLGKFDCELSETSLTVVVKGGITSTWLYPTKQGPRFTRTTILNLVLYDVSPLNTLPASDCLSSSALIIVGAGLNAVYLTRMNARKQKDRAKILAPYMEGSDVKGDGGMRAWMELGDRHPDFRYTI